MAAVQGSQPKQISKGCFKCGKSGHWSRDCNAPPSEWIARPATQHDQGSTPQPAEAAEQPAQLQIPLATGKRKRQKPKLTVEHLKAERHGIAEVFHSFPQLFREQFRGKGHEAGDLKRLLELYVSWQQRILPFSTFDSFMEALEKLGSSYVLKMELRELRAGVLKVMDEPQQEEGGWFGMGEATAAASPSKEQLPAVPKALSDNAQDDMEMPDWDDEDLLAMQAEPMVPNAPAGNTNQHPSTHEGTELELDDDELLELVGDVPQHASAAPHQQQQQHQPSSMAADLDGIDDDELQELADADMDLHNSQQRPEQADQKDRDNSEPDNQLSTAGPLKEQQDVPSHSNNADVSAEAYADDVMLDDDELIELACASLSEEQSKAPGSGPDNKASGSGEEQVTGTAAPLEDTLDDDELLALAITQLDEA